MMSNLCLILKTLYKFDWYAYTHLAVLKVKDIFKLQVLKFTQSHGLNRLPNIFDDYFSVNSDIHAYSTRQVHKICIRKANTLFGSKTIKVVGIALYNSLPSHIINCQNITSFRQVARRHLLSLYL